MKRIFLLLIAMTLFTTTVISQVHSFGVLAGYNISNVSAKNLFVDSDSRLGYIGGLKYELLISDKFLIGADLLYAEQGFLDQMILRDESGIPTGEPAELKYYYDYLALPIRFAYSFGDKFEIAPKVGLQPSVLLAAETTTPVFSDTGDLIGEVTTDDKKNISDFDLAGLIELELGYAVTSNIVVFATVTGKHSITKFSNSNYFNHADLRHKSLAASLGLKYKMIKK